MTVKIVATNPKNWNLKEIVLFHCDSLNEAEDFSLTESNKRSFRKMGYTHLEIVPAMWANTAMGAAPFALKEI